MKLNKAIFEDLNYNRLPEDLVYSETRLASLIDTELQLEIGDNTVDLYNTRDASGDHVINRMKERSKRLEIMTGGFIDDGRNDARVDGQGDRDYQDMLVDALQEIDVMYNMEPYHYMIFSRKEMSVMPFALGVNEYDAVKNIHDGRFIGHATTFMDVNSEEKGLNKKFHIGSKYFNTRNIEVALSEAIDTLCESQDINKNRFRMIKL